MYGKCLYLWSWSHASGRHFIDIYWLVGFFRAQRAPQIINNTPTAVIFPLTVLDYLVFVPCHSFEITTHTRMMYKHCVVDDTSCVVWGQPKLRPTIQHKYIFVYRNRKHWQTWLQCVRNRPSHFFQAGNTMTQKRGTLVYYFSLINREDLR